MSSAFSSFKLLPLAVVLLGSYALSLPLAKAADEELIFRTKVFRTDVESRVVVQLMQPSWRMDLPKNAWLEYDIWLSPENVCFGGGVCVVTLKGSVIQEPTLKDEKGVTTHFVGSAYGLEQAAKGKWYHRRISLARISDSLAMEIFVATSAGFPKRGGINEVRYRNIRLVKENGEELANVTPTLGSLPYPLITGAPYHEEVQIEAASSVSGSFEPDRYLTSSSEALTGSVIVRNLDAVTPAKVSYRLTLQDDAGLPSPQPPISGEVELAPNEEKSIPVKWPPLAAGHVRPILRLQSEKQTASVSGPIITVLNPGDFSQRQKPFAAAGFGMGAVEVVGSTPVQSLPWLREFGANYFQVRIMWSQVETAPGVYDFSCIDPYVKMAKRCGLWLQIDLDSGYPGWSVPSWYRDQCMVSSTGKSELPGNASTPYWAPARQEGLKLLQALLKHYQNTPEIISWNAWTGGWLDGFYLIHGDPKIVGMQDYSSWSQAKFREYVQNVLSLSLDQANSRYGLKLQKWEELVQPSPRMEEIDLRPYWRDFMNYRMWSVGEAQKQATQLVAAGMPKSMSEYLYGGGIGYLGRIGGDFDRGVENARTLGASMHYTGSPGAETQTYLGAAMRRFGVPFSIETGGTPAAPPEHQHAIFELLSQNASVYTYIRSGIWGTLVVPRADYGFGEHRPALERLKGAMPVGLTAAVVYPYSDMIIDPWNRHLKGTQSANDFVRRMETVGYNIDLYTDRTRNVAWKEYPVVIAAFPQALDPLFVEEILRYVREGGKLVVFSKTGEFTPGEEKTRFALLKALGCDPTQAQPKVLVGSPRASFLNGELKGSDVALANYRALGTIPKDAEVWATDRAGDPVLASWKVGRGEVLILAGMPDSAAPLAGAIAVTYGRNGSGATAVTTFPLPVDAIVKQFSGVSRSMTCETDDVLFSFKKKQKDYFVVLFNNSQNYKTARVTLPVPPGNYHAYNLTRRLKLDSVTADKNGMSISAELDPLEITTIQFSPQPIEPPLNDFPVHARWIPSTGGTLSGTALQKHFDPMPVSFPRLSTVQGKECVMALDGMMLNLLFPSAGKFLIEIKTPANARELRLEESDGTTLPLQDGPSSNGAVKVLLEAKSDRQKIKIRYPKDKELPLAWVRITPVFRPFENVKVSSAYENPGLFPGKNFNETLPIEKNILQSSVEAATETKTWRPLNPGSNGWSDLGSFLGKKEGLAYQIWEVESSESKTILLGLGIDYGLKLWLNGASIFDSTKMARNGEPRPLEFCIPVTLRSGKNVFLAKVASGANGWTVQLNSNL